MTSATERMVSPSSATPWATVPGALEDQPEESGGVEAVHDWPTLVPSPT